MYVLRQAVRVFFQDSMHPVPVKFVYFHREVRRDSILLQEHHSTPHPALFFKLDSKIFRHILAYAFY